MNSYLVFALFAEGIAAIGQVFLKRSAITSTKKEQAYKKFINFNVMFGYALFLLSTFLNLLAYKHIDLKLMPALSSISFVYILMFSLFVFKERLNKYQISGMIIIITGIIISCL